MRSRITGNLPPEVSSLVGRERDVLAVESLLENQRLVSLTGPGGVGKTRLALRTAREAAGSFPGGVWFIELATLRDGTHLARHVAEVLNSGNALNTLPIRLARCLGGARAS
ncbi:MAG: hypothetical protein M0R73_12175 [Dehalococcoidia bacterium]|nr:hypothetical protein [Dehalococcoidia bacterium]